MPPELSIVVVSMNTRDWLHQCLSALAENAEVEQEVVVVDNCSEDGSSEMVESDFPHVRLIRNREPYGFARNNNIGAEVCTAPILLFLNSDTKVLPGSLRRMLEVISEHPECGVFGGRLKDAEEDIEHSTGTFPTVSSILCDRLIRLLPVLAALLNAFSQRHYRGYETEHLVDWVTGAYFWIRRDLLEDLGGWDADYFMYYEDADLCYRARKRGYRTLYVPHSTIYHFLNKTPLAVQRRRQLMTGGFRIFSGKHYGLLTRFLARFYR